MAEISEKCSVDLTFCSCSNSFSVLLSLLCSSLLFFVFKSEYLFFSAILAFYVIILIFLTSHFLFVRWNNPYVPHPVVIEIPSAPSPPWSIATSNSPREASNINRHSSIAANGWTASDFLLPGSHFFMLFFLFRCNCGMVRVFGMLTNKFSNGKFVCFLLLFCFLRCELHCITSYVSNAGNFDCRGVCLWWGNLWVFVCVCGWNHLQFHDGFSATSLIAKFFKFCTGQQTVDVCKVHCCWVFVVGNVCQRLHDLFTGRSSFLVSFAGNKSGIRLVLQTIGPWVN